MKRQSFTAVVAATFVALLVSGCGNDSPQACAYQAKQDLNKGEYQKVITELENPASSCYKSGGLEPIDANYTLAGAYMGKSGWDVVRLVEVVADAKEAGLDGMMSGDSNSSDISIEQAIEMSDALDTIIGLIETSEVTKATGIYNGIIAAGGGDCDNPSDELALACMLKDANNSEALGMKDMMDQLKKAQTGAKLAKAGGDDMVEAMNDILNKPEPGSIGDVNDNNKSDKIEVTGCATKDANVTVTGNETNCTSEDTIYFRSAWVEFDKNSTTGTSIKKSFALRIFTVKADVNVSFPDQNYTRLIDQNRTSLPPAPAKVDGKCKLDMTPCDTVNAVIPPADPDNACYPCPVINDDGTATSSTEETVTMINDPEQSAAIAEMIDANLTGYEDDENGTALSKYIKAEANITSEGNLTEEEMYSLFEMMNQ